MHQADKILQVVSVHHSYRYFLPHIFHAGSGVHFFTVALQVLLAAGAIVFVAVLAAIALRHGAAGFAAGKNFIGTPVFKSIIRFRLVSVANCTTGRPPPFWTA